ncbi:uncharacterized protein M437DRAFT_41755 [Aureobasidium melanogenum CBS 110374]|uniref:FAD-binding FR-type domain-containing protein n=1 Tax=Aureobasidium melanogenum (strain CBS 110374) TaxID=1043003 RepID=A0A074VYY9_AURM1|nr:uncharacterized protein M437DRAFT_41755 [Aureobasidium melanogenum CBS 110374]KEQ66030.1 hypothetical protein M437DRAFT_41755 [Aureobasidium melanogenum CBS 110374]
MDSNIKYLTDEEVDIFLRELDTDNDGVIEYDEVEAKLDQVFKELAPEPAEHNLHHEDRSEKRHQFLRSFMGTHKDHVSITEFKGVVESWHIPSMEQEKKEEDEQADFVKKMSYARRLRAYWEVHGPEYGFLALVISMQTAFGVWQLIKYLTTAPYRETFGWGVVLAKTSAGVLYPTMFFLVLSMCRWLSTALRRFYWISRFVNWDLSQAFHIKMSIVALVFASLHAIGHLTGSMLFASRPAQQDEVAAFLGPDAVPRPYVAWIRSLPGWTGLVIFGLFWVIGATSLPWVRRRSHEVFQLGHLLMFPVFAFLMVHGTVGYLQWPMMGYFLAFPVLLVLVERIVRTCNGFSPLAAYLEILDKETVCITVMMPGSRNFDYRAGQYVLLQVPALSRWQWHPFTISTCIGNELQLHIKTDGNWTGNLRKLGTSSAAVKIKIGIDGPYGAPAQRFYDFEQTIIVGAGIGVTPFSGILTDLQAKEEQQMGMKKPSPSTTDLSTYDLSTYKRVDFHWMVRDRNNLLWFSDLLNYISATTASCSSPSNIDFRITTHVTQKRKTLSTHIFRWLLEKHRTPEHPESPITGLINATHFGRPDMKTIMNKHYEDMCVLLAAKKDLHRNNKKKLEDLESGIRVGVFFCGAPVVGYQLADSCRALTARGREDKTFIEYHFMMEVFG